MNLPQAHHNHNDKKKNLKNSYRKKDMTYKGTKIRMIVDLSSEKMQARGQWLLFLSDRKNKMINQNSKLRKSIISKISVK